jgi:hypothetical protein
MVESVIMSDPSDGSGSHQPSFEEIIEHSLVGQEADPDDLLEVVVRAGTLLEGITERRKEVSVLAVPFEFTSDENAGAIQLQTESEGKATTFQIYAVVGDIDADAFFSITFEDGCAFAAALLLMKHASLHQQSFDQFQRS